MKHTTDPQVKNVVKFIYSHLPFLYFFRPTSEFPHPLALVHHAAANRVRIIFIHLQMRGNCYSI